MPVYLAPGVYVDQLFGSAEVLPRMTDTVPGPASFLAPTPARPIRTHWPAPTCTAAFIGIADGGPMDTPTAVTSWDQYRSHFGEFLPGGFLAHAVYGFFQNGGQACYVVRLGTDGPSAAAASAALPTGDPGEEAAYVVTARQAGPAGNGLVVEVGPAASGDGAFDLRVKRDGELVEAFSDLAFRGRGRRRAETVVNDLSLLVQLSVVIPGVRPADGAVGLAGGDFAESKARADEIIGGYEARTGLSGLEALPGSVQVVAVPDLMALYQQGQLTSEAVQAVQLGLIAHCELMGDRIALLDSPPELSPAQVREWRDSVGYESAAGALYYPWVRVHDPLANAPLGVPPSGHVAGVFARTAATRGVHCSPANEPLRGALGTAYPLMRAEIDLLNPRGINTIVAATASGVSVLGGRTLSSDPAWAPVRRRTLANFIHTSMERGMRWVIHETVDAVLWEQVTVELERFCDLLLQAGALSGSSPEEAYQVRCDASTNSVEDRDRMVTAHVFLIVAGGLPLNLRIVFATF